jgi:hypothetical protein
VTLAVAGGLAVSLGKHWQDLTPQPQEKAAYLASHIASYQIGQYLALHPDCRLLQLGLESDLYYLPPQTIGDIFGPGRYRNFFGVPAKTLASRARALGANTLLLSKERPYQELASLPDFPVYFRPIKDSPGAALYSIEKPD